MQSKLITDAVEREDFVRQFESMTKMNISRSYVETLRIFGLYVNNEMIGGCALAFGEDMAWPALTDKSRFRVSGFSLAYSAELNLVWANPSFKKSILDTIFLWWKICGIVSSQKVDYVTFACEDTPKKKSLMDRYEIISSGVLYSGPISKYEGRSMKVWWSTPIKFKMMKVLYIPEYIRETVKRLSRHFRLKLQSERKKEPCKTSQV